MKNYLDQIYYEGLGYTLFVPVEKRINKICNKSLKKSLLNVYRFIYLIFIIAITLLILYYKI